MPKLVADLVIALFEVHQVHGVVLVVCVRHSFLHVRLVVHADGVRLLEAAASWQVVISVIPTSEATQLPLDRCGAFLALASSAGQPTALRVIILVLCVVLADFVNFVELVVLHFCDVVRRVDDGVT